MYSKFSRRQVEVDSERICMNTFTAEGDPGRYQRFHDIRVEVFGRELGWALAPPNGRWNDPFDRGAHFSMAETCDGLPIGILRGLEASTAFPHRELFEPHLEQGGLLGYESTIGTLNALAVLARCRGRRYVTGDDSTESSAARLLLRAGLSALAAKGVKIVLATVLGRASARAFRAAGFQFLDQPRCMPSQECFNVANVGLVLAPATHPDAVHVERARAYFADCDGHVCASGSLDAFLTSSPSTPRTPGSIPPAMSTGAT